MSAAVARYDAGGRNDVKTPDGNAQQYQQQQQQQRPRRNNDLSNHSRCCDHAPALLSGAEAKTGSIWAASKLQPNFYGLYANAAGHKGSRRTMEDRHRIVYGKGVRGFFAVFDGHGGQESAEYASQNLHRYVRYGGNHEIPLDLVVSRPSSVAATEPERHYERDLLSVDATSPPPSASSGMGGLGGGGNASDALQPWEMDGKGRSGSIGGMRPATGAMSSGPRARLRGGDEMKQELELAFQRTEEDILALARRQNFKDGTTAATLFVYGDTLYAANCGDSRVVLCRGGQAIALSHDHKPGNDEEKKRIVGVGGEVRPVMKERPAFCCFPAKKVPQGADRLWPGGFSVSRALGDIDYKDPRRGKVRVVGTLIAKPEVLVSTITKDDEFVVIGTDGLWDVMTNQEAVDYVRKEAKKKSFDPDRIAEQLTNRAFQLGSEDNISAVVIFFTHHREWPIDFC